MCSTKTIRIRILRKEYRYFTSHFLNFVLFVFRRNEQTKLYKPFHGPVSPENKINVVVVVITIVMINSVVTIIITDL